MLVIHHTVKSSVDLICVKSRTGPVYLAESAMIRLRFQAKPLSVRSRVSDRICALG